MKFRSMRVVSLSALIIGGLFIAEASQAVAEGYLVEEENHMVALVNQHRASVGLPSLRSDAGLQLVARRQTSRMVAAGYIYHNPNLAAEAGAAVPGWLKIGENVGVGGDTVTVENAFLASPHHLENIEEPSFSLIGLGAESGPTSAMYFTQDYAAEGSSRAAPPAAPAAPAAPARPAPTAPPSRTPARAEAPPAPAPARRPAPAPVPTAPRPTPATRPAVPAQPPASSPAATAPATTEPPSTEPPSTEPSMTLPTDGSFVPPGVTEASLVHLVPVEARTTADRPKQHSRVGMWRTIGAVLSRVADKVIP